MQRDENREVRPHVAARSSATPPEQVHDIGRRRAWVIWGVAVAVYALAVFNRSSLGVAGIMAAHRFDIAATQLAFFAVLQLIVYAGMQVPVGVLLDRFGPRALLLSGLGLMTGAQLLFAFAESFEVAVLARGLVGAGDAMIFVTVIRLVATWFRPRQVPMITQMTGWVGQLGSIAAATPLTLLLAHYGWTRTFAITSTVGVVLLVAVLALVKNSPYRPVDAAAVRLGELARSVRAVWANPGTRLGFWVHFTTQCSFTVFVLLWGVPFLVRGEGWTEVEAGTLLMVMTGWVVVSGSLIALATTRRPWFRSWLAVGVVVAQVVLWTIVLLLDTAAPVWLLVLLALAIATGAPASVIGFDLVRTFTPVSAVGRATGIVNVGGFVASLVLMALIGTVLDHSEPGGMGAYDLDDFRLAFCAQYGIWALGITQILRLRFRAIRHLDATHPGAVETLRSGQSFVPDE